MNRFGVIGDSKKVLFEKIALRIFAHFFFSKTGLFATRPPFLNR